MATFAMAMDFHDGEKELHALINGGEVGGSRGGFDNPTVTALSQQLAVMLQRGPLLAVGTLDAAGDPWCSVWGGGAGFAAALGGGLMGVRSRVDGMYDPVVQALVGGYADGEVVREEGRGRMVGGLSINLETRKRVKLYGRMVAGAVSRGLVDSEDVQETEGAQEEDGSRKEEEKSVAELQLVVKIEQSLGNCPKYLNKKAITPAIPSPKLLSDSIKLPEEAIDLIHKSDLFFISSSRAVEDMDTNHRGGMPGFVRVASNDETGAEIIYPEYSGNRLYQTLGNLRVTPRAGLVFPDFETGNVLYVTGTTKILIGQEAADVLPKSNLAVSIKVTGVRFVQNGLPFRGAEGERSPYNPDVRLLATEGSLAAKFQGPENTAQLLERKQITPTISRYRFAMMNPVQYEPGQWVALDFSRELDMGYSHMRDDDPRSLNDDWIRTFTVSSPPGQPSEDGKTHNEFEITIRTVGPVTAFMTTNRFWKHSEVAIRGFGGDFRLRTAAECDDLLPFVAGGVGITPLLGQVSGIDFKKLRLFWTLRLEDFNLAAETLTRNPGLGAATSIFFTAAGTGALSEEQRQAVEALRSEGAIVETRRITKEDLDAVKSDTWYLCAATGLQKALLDMLKGKRVIYESFNY